MNTTAPTTETMPAVTPEAMAHVIAAIIKISQALDRMDGTLEQIHSTLALLQEQSIAQTAALEQIQMYQR